MMEPFSIEMEDSADVEENQIYRVSSAVPRNNQEDQRVNEAHAGQLRDHLHRRISQPSLSERRRKIREFMMRHVPSKAQSVTPYCNRHGPAVSHRRPPDEITLESVQKELDGLSTEDQEVIRDMWSVFGAAPGPLRSTMMKGLITQCCLPQLSLVSSMLPKLLKLDFITVLPPELGFQILGSLDTASLCAAAQVSKRWKSLADDDSIWSRMCQQHIDRKCDKCGWGLPLMEKKRIQETRRRTQIRALSRGINAWEPDITPVSTPPVHVPHTPESMVSSGYRTGDELSTSLGDHVAGRTMRNLSASDPSINLNGKRVGCQLGPMKPDPMRSPFKRTGTDATSYFESQGGKPPWKDVYRDRWKIGSNWKQGRYNLRTIRAHEEGVTCLFFDEMTLATGSYDCTIKLWNIATGKEIRTLTGHTDRIRALQFDSTKLISGSMDGVIKIWNWKTGCCVCTYPAHADGVIGLHLDGDLMASCSADETIKVWSFKTRAQFVLRGHAAWVNSVKLHVQSKTLFSASDDCTIKMWDLKTLTCIQTFVGHIGQVQQVLILPPEFEPNEAFVQSMRGHLTPPHDESGSQDDPDEPCTVAEDFPLSSETQRLSLFHQQTVGAQAPSESQRPGYILSGSLDNTIALWSVETGQCLIKFFGHVEGVWAMAADKLRVVSGAQDRTVKIWDARTGRCERTFAGGNGHRAAVSCIGLGDDKVISGSEDGEVKIWGFGSDAYRGKEEKEKADEE